MLEPRSGLLDIDCRLLTQLPDLALNERRSRTPDEVVKARWKDAQTSLQKLIEQLRQRKKAPKLIKQLLDLVEGMGKVVTYRSAEDQFHRLRNLRMWVFWLPVTMFDADWSVDDLVAMAYYYAVAVLASDLCPEIGSIQLALDSMGPIARIVERVLLLNTQHNGEFGQQCEQLEYPEAVLNYFRESLDMVRPCSSSELSMPPSPSSPYGPGVGDHHAHHALHNHHQLGPVAPANSQQQQQLLQAPYTGTPPTFNPASPSLSVYPHNSPATPVFSPATGQSPQSFGYGNSPVTPVMSVFSPFAHGGSPLVHVPPPVSSLHTQDSPLTPDGASPFFHTPDSGYHPKANLPGYIKTEPFGEALFVNGPVHFDNPFVSAHGHAGGSLGVMAGFPPMLGSGSPGVASPPSHEAHHDEEAHPPANPPVFGDEQGNIIEGQWLGGPLFPPGPPSAPFQ
jgi:hypothetical protein